MQAPPGTHPQPPEEDEIVNIWKHNLEDEFIRIRSIVQKYPCIGMDTEFPGVVARPRGEFRSASEYQYQLLRCNVDMLKIIQLGLTFFDQEGNKVFVTKLYNRNRFLAYRVLPLFSCI